VIGSPGKPYRGPFYGEERNGPSYYPYATIAWDYINRSMPVSNPGSLTPNEVYALVAFLYYWNGTIKENDVMDEKTLPKVEMPNRKWLRSGSAGLSPEKETQLVLSASAGGHRAYEMMTPAARSDARECLSWMRCGAEHVNARERSAICSFPFKAARRR